MNALSSVITGKPVRATVHWKQVVSLTALYAAIVIGWIAYHNYQPKLLEKFNLSSFAFPLVLVQGIVLAITPPIAGILGDRFRRNGGNRLPIITLGISFASMVFMAVAFALFTDLGPLTKWMLPVLIVLWLVAMSIFTSPALSTLELFSPAERLPNLMALLTIVANLLYALEPVIVDIIDFAGAPATFMTGGLIVLITGYSLRRNSLALFGSQEDSINSGEPTVTKSGYGFILWMGVCLGIATGVLFNIAPTFLENKLSPLILVNGKVVVVGMLVLSGLLSVPISEYVTREGLHRSFRFGFLGLLACFAAFPIFSSPLAAALLCAVFSVMFTVLSVSTLPLTIRLSRFDEKVFCVGIFFCGVAIPDAVIKTILAY